MKKLLTTFIVGFLLIMPLSVLAIDLGGGLVNKAATKAGYDSNTNEQSLAELIGTVIQTVLSFVGVIFLVLMVYAGYLWMTARGEESQIEKAQDIIRSSVIGMVVTLGAFSITTFVVPRILEKTTGDATGGGGNGGTPVLCCVQCEDSGDCQKSVVTDEGQCLDGLGNCQGPVNIDKTCSVSSVPADQCGGNIERINCCIIEKPGNVIEKDIASPADCQQKCAINNGDDAGFDVDNDWSCDSQVMEASQCN